MILHNILIKIKNKVFDYFAIDLLAVILILAFFVRVYRIGDLLGFYYDQGRDALVIWKLWHVGKPFLIGPITGLKGIYLGPLYYYLIAPFYLIGGGNPVYPATFLVFLSTLAVLMIYLLGRDMHGRGAGIFAATIAAFSYYIVKTSRWFSNPSPILLFSLLLLYSMWRIIKSKSSSKSSSTSTGTIRFPSLLGINKWWIAVALLLGVSLQFESASAVFYIPVVVIFALWQKKKLPNLKTQLFSIGIFLVTLVPQIIFNFRHDNILLNNFSKLFLQEKAFRPFTEYIFEERIKFFWSVFSTKLYPGKEMYASIFVTFSLAALYVKKRFLKNGLLQLFLIFMVTPMIFYIFFQGNFGNIYDYYMAGYYLPFILLFAIGLAEFQKSYFGKIVTIIFFITFLQINGIVIRNVLTDSMNGPTDVKLTSQLKAVNWVLEDAQGRIFNVDTYVPPVIPYAYDYLFLWQTTKKCGVSQCGMKQNVRVSLLYTLYEQDPPSPERLEAWLKRQEGIGRVEQTVKFGGITVERRIRIF